MIKKYIVIIISTVVFLGTIVVFTLSSSWAQGFLKTPQERALEQHDREMAECKRTERPLECLMEKDQQREEERRRNMTPEEKRQSEEGEQRIKEQWAEIQRLVEEGRMRPIPTPLLTREHFKNNPQQFPDFEKIQEGSEGTRLKNVLLPVNYWSTFQGGEGLSVSAGSAVEDPLQGIVVIQSDKASSIKTYPTPSKTGPVKIVSANGETGIIELVSIAGEWNQVDPDQLGTGIMLPGKVFTHGGARYIFNVRTRKFQ